MSKIILITGSSKGIGATLARLAKKKGYEVILHGKKLSKDLKLIRKELGFKYVTFDVCNTNEIKKAIKNINKIDILVNSAGINISKPFIKLKDKDWKSIYNTNILGVANVIKCVLPIIKKSQGFKKIINIASVKGTYSAVGYVAYASSKAAIINLTTGLAKEFAPDIMVNSVSPGFVDTEMTNRTWSKRIQKQVKSILLKRIATPDEIANVILFLCSDECTYINGQNIIVDGGFGIKNE